MVIILLVLGIVSTGHAEARTAFQHQAAATKIPTVLTSVLLDYGASAESPAPVAPDIILFNSPAEYPPMWYLVPLSKYQRQIQGIIRKGHGNTSAGVACCSKFEQIKPSKLSSLILAPGNLHSLSPDRLILRL
ncbi:MAG: hypothetical protein A2Z15_03905 [Chloroflexi bacterium RBG_16_50_11]|nr:MAG: hypothetical protein A2Z15_03905 [Chloroflexi bacterium RBG_16_50_11]